MNESTQLAGAVAELLDYLADPDVVDEVSVRGGTVQGWKSDEFKALIQKAQEALSPRGLSSPNPLAGDRLDS
jgi:hypothetical protein